MTVTNPVVLNGVASATFSSLSTDPATQILLADYAITGTQSAGGPAGPQVLYSSTFQLLAPGTSATLSIPVDANDSNQIDAFFLKSGATLTDPVIGDTTGGGAAFVFVPNYNNATFGGVSAFANSDVAPHCAPSAQTIGPVVPTNNVTAGVVGQTSYWFSIVMNVTNLNLNSATEMQLTNASITINYTDSTSATIPIPNATTFLSSRFNTASTSFDALDNKWITTAPAVASGNVFLDGHAVPYNGKTIANYSVTGSFQTNTPAINVNWQFGVAAYQPGFTDSNSLLIKPVDLSTVTVVNPSTGATVNLASFNGSDHTGNLAGTPLNVSAQVIAGGSGAGGTNFTGSLTAANNFTCGPVNTEVGLFAAPALATVNSNQGALLNAVNSALLGGTQNLTVLNYQGLAQGNISLGQVLSALQTQLGVSSPSQALGTSITLTQLLNAEISAAQTQGNTALVSALQAQLLQVGTLTGTIQLGQLFSAPLNQGSLTTANINALDLLTGAVQLYNFNNVATTPTPIGISGATLTALSPALAGLVTGVTIQAQVVEPPIFEYGTVGLSFHSAGIRLKTDFNLVSNAVATTGLVGILQSTLRTLLGSLITISVNSINLGQLQVYTEVAEGQGTISAINAISGAVTVQATPGLTNIYLGTMADTVFFNRTHVINAATDLTPINVAALTINATLLGIPVVGINGQTAGIGLESVALGQAPSATSLTFNPPFPQTQTISTSPTFITNLVSSLVSNLQVSILGSLGTVLDPLVNGTILPALSTAVTGVVTPALSPLLTGLVEPTLQALGIGIGELPITILDLARFFGPVATNDVATAVINTPIAIPVLPNDFVNSGDTVTVTSVTQPAHGAASINANQTITYTPTNGYTGSDSFTYTETDATTGFTSTATVAVNVTPLAAVTFINLDSSDRGNWKGVYGSDGFNVAQDLSANNPTIPAYATVSFTGASNFTWAASTTDPRALQKTAVGSTDRIAGVWYSGTGFNINIGLSDGQLHQIVLYAVDWDNLGRNETIRIVNQATGAVLDTQTISGFQNGVYLVYNVQGNVTIQVTNNNPQTSAVLSGLFFAPDPPGVINPGSASFVTEDDVTQGNWKQAYGADGFDVSQDDGTANPTVPSYATVSFNGGSDWTWAGSTSDVRALQTTADGSTDRVAGTWYDGTGFNINIDMTDGQSHLVSLYALDWDNLGRSEQITVIDADSGDVLDTRNLSDFASGKYLVWNLKGNITISVTNTDPTGNAVLSGLFFGGAPVGSSTASFVGLDSTTQGNWQGVYGSAGSDVAEDITGINPSLPPGATIGFTGAQSWAWAGSTTDTRALQTSIPGSTDRVAGTWFSGSGFDINLDFTDGQSHQVALYALDWDNLGRSEQIQIVDGDTGAVLDTQTLSDFANGVYAVWNLKGNVVIHVTNLNPNANAVLSGLFLG